MYSPQVLSDDEDLAGLVRGYKTRADGSKTSYFDREVDADTKVLYYSIIRLRYYRTILYSSIILTKQRTDGFKTSYFTRIPRYCSTILLYN